MSFDDFIQKFAQFRQSGRNIGLNKSDNKEGYDRITQEPVLALQPDGQVLVGGSVGMKLLSVLSKNIQVQVGEIVYVAWNKGIAIGILKYAWQKAQFAPSGRLRLGIIEELFIAADPKTEELDVYFRNDQQVTNLKIAALLEGEVPVDVNWGKGRNKLIVTTGDDVATTKWWIFSLDREPDKVLGTKTPTATLFAVWPFADFILQISRMDFTFMRASSVPVPHLVSNPGSDVFNGFNRFDDTAQVTRRLTLFINEGDVEVIQGTPGTQAGSVFVSNLSLPILDNTGQLFIVVTIQMEDFGCLPGGSDGLLGSHEVLKTADGATCPNRETVGPAPFDRFSDFFKPYFRFQQQHVLLLNISTNAMVWSTLKDIIELTATESFNALAYPVFDTLTSNVIPDSLRGDNTYRAPWSNEVNGSFTGDGTVARLEFRVLANEPLVPHDPIPEGLVILSWETSAAGTTANAVTITFEHVADAGASGTGSTSGALGGFGAKAVIDSVAGNTVHIQWQRGVDQGSITPPGPNDVLVTTYVSETGATVYRLQQRLSVNDIIAAWSLSAAAKALAVIHPGSGQGQILSGYPNDQPAGVFEPVGAFNFTGGSGTTSTPTSTCTSLAVGLFALTAAFDDPSTNEFGDTGDWGVTESNAETYSESFPFFTDALDGILQEFHVVKRTPIHWRSSKTGSAASVSVFFNRTALVTRYEPVIDAIPFYAKDGEVRTFIVLSLIARNPTGVTEAVDDGDFIGIFVIIGDTVYTLKAFDDTLGNSPFLFAASGHRLLWTDESDVKMTDLETVAALEDESDFLTAVVGTDFPSFNTALNPWLTNPDFLIAQGTPAETQPLKFIDGWNRSTGEIKLDQAADGFPIEDTKLKPLAGRKDLPENLVPLVSSLQTINDKTLLGSLGINEVDSPIPPPAP